MKRAKIILADGQAQLLETVRPLLEPEFEVVDTVPDVRALNEGALAIRPDVIVLDIETSLINGLNASQQLRQAMPDAKLIYLAMSPDPELANAAFRLGAAGYLLKSNVTPELVQAIREVLAGRLYVTPQIANGRLGSCAPIPVREKPVHQLTTRQREVLQLLVEGRSMREAAAILNVTPRTVAFHKYKMMEQLNIKTNAELIQYAIKHSITGF